MKIDFDAFDAVLLDLDGTVYHEEHALPGAVKLIHRLQREGRKYACLTNSTSSPERLTARLGRMGVKVDAAHIYTAAAAAADYVIEHLTLIGEPGATDRRRPRIFNLSTEGIHEMLDGRVDWLEPEDKSKCDAVIVGVPLNVFATPDRQRAAMIRLREGAALVAICADRVYPSPRGLEFGVGSMAAMLSYASGAKPVYCGKPERFFFEDLCHRLGVAPARCILFGDNLESDIAGGKGVGMRTAMTLCGVSTREDALKLPESARPDWIINDLSDVAG